jgi:hypothetical protein
VRHDVDASIFKFAKERRQFFAGCVLPKTKYARSDDVRIKSVAATRLPKKSQRRDHVGPRRVSWFDITPSNNPHPNPQTAPMIAAIGPPTELPSAPIAVVAETTNR